jgi:hypothetical protein
MNSEASIGSKRGLRALAVSIAAALIFVFGAIGKAQAAECTSVQDCVNAATWQKAISDDFYKKAFFAGADSKKNFETAADWHNKSVGAFLSGNGSAAQLYQALANDSAQKAAASAKAADSYLAQAKFWAAAAHQSGDRGAFLLALELGPGPSAAEDQADSQEPGEGADFPPGSATAASNHEYCKNAPNPPTYKDGVFEMTVRPGTFCHKGYEVTRVDFAREQSLSQFGDLNWHVRGCDDVKRSWAGWRGAGPHSARRLVQTCHWGSLPHVVDVDCSVSLYFHFDGSHYYPKKMHCVSHNRL